MLEPPDFPDERLIDGLQAHYGLRASTVEFLPRGNETGVWVYRAHAGEENFFLKLRLEEPRAAVLQVPRALRDMGIQEVVAPLPGLSGLLSASLGENFHLVVYPFIAGENGMEKGQSAAQWTALGQVLRRIHEARLPADLRRALDSEGYALDPPWVETIAAITAKVRGGLSGLDPLAQETGSFWLDRLEEIERAVSRGQALGRALRRGVPQEVLCHCDIHAANLMLDPVGGLHVVDWDQPLYAPKERDLMFHVDANGPNDPPGEQEVLFFAGYGEVQLNWTGIAYYRYNWTVQEIADYARRVFLIPGLGEVTRLDAAGELRAIFTPGNLLDWARAVWAGEEGK